MKKSQSNSGFGIIEILVAFGLVGILTAVMTTLFSNIQKQQRQTNMVTSINTLRETILKTITDGRAWEATINDAANRAASTDCLVNRTACTHTVAGAAPNPPTNAFYNAAPFNPLPILRIVPAPADPLINNVATSGFRLNGDRCNDFIAPPAAGNDACPFQWRLRTQYVCPAAAANCVDPTIIVIAMLIYNPNPASGLAVTINESKYMIIVTRGARGENRSERLVYHHQGTGAGTGGGACNPNNWTNIPLGVEIVDEGNNGTLAAGVVTLLPGTYNCTATASCFSCRSLMMRLNVGGALTASPGSVGPDGTMLNVSVTRNDIRINAPTPVSLQHFCVSHPVCLPACPVTYGMGMALADYSIPTQFSTLNCTRVF
jgi:type II secretory pathway pseudopilin PulG